MSAPDLQALVMKWRSEPHLSDQGGAYYDCASQLEAALKALPLPSADLARLREAVNLFALELDTSPKYASVGKWATEISQKLRALLTDAPPSAETRRAPEDVGQPVTASKGVMPVMPSEPDLQAEATPPAERLQPLDALIAKYEATKGRGHMSSKDVFLAELVRLLAALREAETPQPNGS